MGEGGTERLVAWATEMRVVHQRLRDALAVAFEAVSAAEAEGAAAVADAVTRDLRLYCHGFCVALERHHRGEDAVLFPGIEAAHPELADVLAYLRQDHRVLDHLLGDLVRAVEAGQDPARLLQHLEGVAALMESHFGYEERQLLGVLERLALRVPVEDALGPLAAD